MADNKYRYQVGQKVIVRERRYGEWFYKVCTVYRVGATIGVYTVEYGLIDDRRDRVYPKELVPYSEQVWAFVQSHMQDIEQARQVIANKIKLINGILDDAKVVAEREQAEMYARLRSMGRTDMENLSESEEERVDTVITVQ